MSTNAINSFLARRQAEKEGPKNKGGNGQKSFMTKEDKKKKYFAPKADKENFRVIIPAATGNHYEEAYFHELSVDGGQPQQFYCLKHNDGKPCPLCEKREQLKAESKLLPFGSDEAKVLFKASNAYEPRKFYIFKGISRGHLSDGIKFWRIKENFKKDGAMDKIESEIADLAENSSVDFADVNVGYDIQVKTVEQNKTMGSGTYRSIQSIKLVGPKPLDQDEAEIAKLVNDTMTWKEIYTPIAINGHLDEYQFLQAVVEGRAPFWDKAQSKWILTNENGEQYPAEYTRTEATTTVTAEAPVAEPVAETTAPVTTEAPAKKASGKKAVVADDNDLPF